jgi:hypothetical protein
MWEEEGDNWGKKDDKKGKVWVNMIKVHYIHMWKWHEVTQEKCSKQSMQHHELYLKLKNLKQKIINFHYVLRQSNKENEQIFFFSFSDTSHTVVEHKAV